MKTYGHLLIGLGWLWLSGGCAPAPVPQILPRDGGAAQPLPTPAADVDGASVLSDCLAVRDISIDNALTHHTIEASAACRSIFRIVLEVDTMIEVRAVGASLVWNGINEDEPGWLATKRWLGGDHTLSVTPSTGETVVLHIWNHGALATQIRAGRSLVWTLSSLLDDGAELGLGRILGNIAADGHGAALFADWMNRFSTTAHSERAGPAILIEEMADLYGAQVEDWDLNRLPFATTAVHNRIDLRTDESCGEMRISFASTHSVWRPLHLLFIYDQTPRDDDISPGGHVHCHGTARRWAALSLLDEQSFLQKAKAWLSENTRVENFLLAESEELTVSPWEWRQWWLEQDPQDSTLPARFENRALFQTVDIAVLNESGPLRESFLAFVEDNAPTLDEQRALLPEQFRPMSVRVNAGVPWTPLDLNGVNVEVLHAHPKLRQHIEAIGCAGCHAAADFVQVREDRSFSAFYENELVAREAHLKSLLEGALDAHPHFGALQSEPPHFP